MSRNNSSSNTPASNSASSNNTPSSNRGNNIPPIEEPVPQNRGMSQDGESSQSPANESLRGGIDDRAQHDVQYYRNFLEQLLGAIGTRDQASVASLINLIRSGASEAEIQAAVAQIPDETRSTGSGGRNGGRPRNGQV